jgi:hypothetical protein
VAGALGRVPLKVGNLPRNIGTNEKKKNKKVMNVRNHKSECLSKELLINWNVGIQKI